MSIFNFKRRADEPYELGRLISSNGSQCDFFNVRHERSLGVKIIRGHNKSKETSIQRFVKEMEISKVFERFEIPVPKHIDIIDVKKIQVK